MTTKFILPATLGVGAIGGAAGLGYWCSLPKDLQELLKRENVKLLDVNSDKDDEQWKKLVEKYKEPDEAKKLKKINGLKIETPSSPDSKDFKKLKSECKKLFEKPVENSEAFETAKENVKDWCSSNLNVLTKEAGSVASAG